DGAGLHRTPGCTEAGRRVPLWLASFDRRGGDRAGVRLPRDTRSSGAAAGADGDGTRRRPEEGLIGAPSPPRVRRRRHLTRPPGGTPPAGGRGTCSNSAVRGSGNSVAVLLLHCSANNPVHALQDLQI